jgi:hypothetical protein
MLNASVAAESSGIDVACPPTSATTQSISFRASAATHHPKIKNDEDHREPRGEPDYSLGGKRPSNKRFSRSIIRES